MSSHAANGAVLVDNMLNAELKIGGVSLRGIKPEMSVVIYNVPLVFARHGFDCWLTSGVRPLSLDSLHSFGFALDFDASTYITEEIGQLMAYELSLLLGKEFDVLWHKTKKGNFHLHVEFDYNGKGVANYNGPNLG